MKLPYLKFFYGDWLRDTSLSSCSPSTRGIWIDLLCRMHDGHTWKVDGNLEQLARMARCSIPEVLVALVELGLSNCAKLMPEGITSALQEHYKTITCNGPVTPMYENVTVVCRRLQREDNQLVANRERVRKYRSNAGVIPKKQPLSYSYSLSNDGKACNEGNVKPERETKDSLSNASTFPPVEPHPNWPKTADQAVAAVALTGAPETVVLEEWHRANAVGGCNRSGTPIRNWPSYFAACYAARRSREAEKGTHHSNQAGKSTGAERAFAGEARTGITLKARDLS